MSAPIKHHSTTEPGLKFWAERDEDDGVWRVIQQVTGYPATEAHDDWFAKFEDADEIAQQLARGENIHA